MDVSSVAALATAFSKIVGLANQGKIADVQRDLIELQRNVMEVVADADAVMRENKDLREKLRLKENLKRDPAEGVLWLEGNGDPGPYCTACWDKGQDAIRIHVGNVYAACPVCKEKYYISDVTRDKHGFRPNAKPPAWTPPRSNWVTDIVRNRHNW